MKLLRHIIAIACIAAASFSHAAEQPPLLSLSKASKLADDAIASASLPADCFLRSLELVQRRDPATRTRLPAYYRAIYKPAPVQPPKLVDPVAQFISVDVIRIAMDGKVSFEQEEVPRMSIEIK